MATFITCVVCTVYPWGYFCRVVVSQMRFTSLSTFILYVQLEMTHCFLHHYFYSIIGYDIIYNIVIKLLYLLVHMYRLKFIHVHRFPELFTPFYTIFLDNTTYMIHKSYLLERCLLL